MANSKKLHFAMFPWFAFGHLTPFLHLSNKLAQRGHRVSFLLPNKALIHLQGQNLHPDLITFYPLKVPAVDGLPQGAETASDVALPVHTHLATAFDMTRDQVETLVAGLVPDFVFYDFSHWLPEFASALGIKTVRYSVLAAACLCETFTPAARRTVPKDGFFHLEFGKGVKFYDRIASSFRGSDAICFRTCLEIEGKYVDSLRKMWAKPVLVSGLGLPEEEDVDTRLDPKWVKWLNMFGTGTVVFCALGSQIVLEKPQFQELLLGFESTGLPFLLVLKPPVGSSSVEEALPDGFEERVEGRGVVYGGWVQQSLILKHVSLGCFVTHCGFGSMWEALVISEGQIVALPHLSDQVLNAKLLAEDLKVGVEVKRGENGWVSKEGLCAAIKSVMNEESEVGREVRRNHLKYREMLSKDGLMSGYIDQLVEDLQQLKNDGHFKQSDELKEALVPDRNA